MSKRVVSKSTSYAGHANAQVGKAKSGSRGTPASPDRFVSLAAKACRKRGKSR